MQLSQKWFPDLAYQISKVQGKRNSFCCPPQPPCGASGQGAGRRVVPPATCRLGPIPPNPCMPRYPHGKDSWKKYKYLALFVLFPVIIIQTMRTLGKPHPPKQVCRDYEYMRIRTKKFPWGNGVETFFHNPHVNHLPGDCEPPPLDC